MDTQGSRQWYWILDRIGKKWSNNQESFETYESATEAFDKMWESTTTWKELKRKLSYSLIIRLNTLKGKLSQKSWGTYLGSWVLRGQYLVSALARVS